MMGRAVIVKVFVGSLVGFVAAVVLFLVAGGLAVWSGAFVMDGPDVVGIQPDAFAWSMIGLVGVAVLVMVGAALGLFVAWIGAVLTTANLPDKTWLIILLVGGLLSVGFIVTLVYVVAGPDGRPAGAAAHDGRVPLAGHAPAATPTVPSTAGTTRDRVPTQH